MDLITSAKMKIFALLIAFAILNTSPSTSAQRIKRKPVSQAEVAHIAAQQAMNDPMLHNGDIVVTEDGFFRQRRTTADGSNVFLPIANPLSLYRLNSGSHQ